MRPRRRRWRTEMLLIPCPWCGPRPENEFRYGGEAHVVRPADPAALDDAAWAEFLYMREQSQRACTLNGGATRMAAAASSTACAIPSATASPRPTSPARRVPRHRHGAPSRAAASGATGRSRSRFDGQRLRRVRGRYAGLRPAGERRAPGRAVVQVPPAARHPVAAGSEEPNALVTVDRGGGAVHAEPARDPGGAAMTG